MGISLRSMGWALHDLGPAWLAYRLGYELRRRSGWLRLRFPTAAWDEEPLANFLSNERLAQDEAYLAYRRDAAPPFFFDPAERESYASLLRKWDEDAPSPVAAADGILHGQFPLFQDALAEVGFPPDWHADPFTAQRWPAELHWSQISDSGASDARVIWELGRFAPAYTLVRAYWRTGDERFPEAFWTLVEDWRAKNAPQRGPHWMSGQEIAFRIMAWCFGLYGMLHSKATSAERVAGLAQMVAVSARRIEGNLGYALSQRNNHGISEAAGLWTAGLLFPELRQAAHWRGIGGAVLQKLERELIYADGAFAQHSACYHRLMLHDYLWAIRLGDVCGSPLSAQLRQGVGKAVEFLAHIQAAQDGRVPNYGQNDGSRILPLNNCAWGDYRPVLQAAGYLCSAQRRYASGAWDEDLLWLFGPQALQAPQAAEELPEFSAPQGGCHGFRSRESYAMLRCATYRHRPGQADQLHFDLWWRGQNVALDAGTYSYNHPSPWDNPLAAAFFHSTVTVDDLDQMQRLGRFLWLPWLRGTVQSRQQTSSGRLAYWQGAHNGYQRLRPPAYHQRAVVKLWPDVWLVLDRLWSAQSRAYRLHWLLTDAQHAWSAETCTMVLHLAGGEYQINLGALERKMQVSITRADASTPRGWVAPCYMQRQPALSLATTVDAPNVLFWTILGPGPIEATQGEAQLMLQSESWQAAIDLRPGFSGDIVRRIVLHGAIEEQLEISA
jgi:hypothetical protein